MGAQPSKAITSEPALNEKRVYDSGDVDSATQSFSTLAVSDATSSSDSGKPLSTDGSIVSDNLEAWEHVASKDPRISVSRSILNHTEFKSALLNRKKTTADIHVYNTKLDFEGNKKVTNQKSSGRCWLFATTNVIRYNIAKSLGLEDFQLSQSYLFFFDKLNKANYYLELTLENAELPLDDRLIVHLASDPVGDGGQWDMVLNLLKNYGVVPQSIFPESYSSSSSSKLNQLVTTKLREHALLLRKSASVLRSSPALAHLTAQEREEKIIESLRKEKEKYVGEIYKILTVTLGEPPKATDKFTWEYYTAKGEYKKWHGTPLEFYKTFGSKQYPHLEAFSLINDPRNDYDKLYTVDKLGNVWNGLPIRYVNTTSEKLQAAVVKTIKAGQPVFFGCDVGKSSENSTGIMDTGLYDIENAFGISLNLSKADRLRTGESAMTHAMVITAVHLDESGKPVRFRVENSWNDTVGDHGYFTMTSSWFDEYVFQVVIPKQLASADQIKVLDSKPVVLPPWDPLGALA